MQTPASDDLTRRWMDEQGLRLRKIGIGNIAYKSAFRQNHRTMKKIEQNWRVIRDAGRLAGITGVILALKSIFTKTQSTVSVRVKGLSHSVFIRIGASDIPTYKKVFVKKEYACRFESPPHVIVDAGANIGLATLYFANQFPDAKIIAIEPEYENFRLLKQNTEPYKNVVALNVALWNENGTINLFDPGIGSWGFVTENATGAADHSNRFCHQVQSVTVDRLIADYGLKTIDILKIDIEGAEREVFQDSSSWIGHVRSIMIELHEHLKPGCDRSFYNGSNGFDLEWKQGENIFLTKDKSLIPNDTSEASGRPR